MSLCASFTAPTQSRTQLTATLSDASDGGGGGGGGGDGGAKQKAHTCYHLSLQSTSSADVGFCYAEHLQLPLHTLLLVRRR